MKLKNYFIKLGLYSLCLCSPLQASSYFENNDDITQLQQEWAQEYITPNNIVNSSNLENDLKQEFNQLSVVHKPHTDLHHLYIHGNDGEYKLVKLNEAQSFKLIRLYGPTNEGTINYTTHARLGELDLNKETLINPRPSPNKFSGSERGPTAKSTSYPKGCYAYHYTLPTGRKIEFQKGHGIPHADTLKHSGKISTKDSENYVPQNAKYNSPIRRDLEEELRQKGFSYKEISIYHPINIYPVTVNNKGTKHWKVPIPEGFIVLVLNQDDIIQDSYYFPNFVDYEELNPHANDKKDKKYSLFLDKYKIPDLHEWFWNASVKIGEAYLQDAQVKNAEIISSSIIFRDFVA